jgi:hypothetical protein
MSRSQAPHDGGTKPCRCGERRPETITRRGPFRGLCYECTKESFGRKRTEKHHPFGRDNPAVAKIAVETPGNSHRALDHRRARRSEMLRHPGDNPLHRVAAVVATVGEAADALADYARRQEWPNWVAELAGIFARVAGDAANWLLILADRLDDKLGPTWVEHLDMPPWPL